MRLKSVDIVRAMAIVFVVVGHALIYAKCGGFLMGLIYSFHMALFFVLSGFVAAAAWERHGPTDGAFALRKMGRCAKRLLVPYAICGVVVVPTVNFLLTGRLAESFFGGWRNAFLLNRFLWYLPCCFLLTCIFCVVALSARGTRGIRWHVGVAAALAAVVSARWLFPGVDYFRSVVNYFVPFFAGAWLWSWHDRVLHPGRFLTVCSSLAFAVFAVLYASWPGMPLVAKGVVKPLAGVASLFPLMAIANTLKGFVSSAVAHIGRITLFIYCFDFCATPIMTWHFHPGGVISSLAVAFGVVALGVFFNLAWEYAVLPEIKRHLV